MSIGSLSFKSSKVANEAISAIKEISSYQQVCSISLHYVDLQLSHTLCK